MASEESISYDSSLSKDIDAKSIAVIALSSLSLLGSVLIMVTILGIRSWKAEVGNRVSLKLTFWIAFGDFMFSIFSLLLTSSYVSDKTCPFFMWGYVQFTLLPIFLTVAIGFNLQVVFVHGSKNLFHYQRYFVPICLGLSLVISLPPVIAKQFELDPAVNACWYKATYSNVTIVWEVMTLYGWILLGVIYCGLAVTLVAWKLYTNDQKLANNTGPIHSHLIGHKTSRAVKRIVLYPLIPIITQTFNFVSEFDTFVNRDLNSTIYVLSAVTPVCMGLLNAIVFLFDPAFQLFWRGLVSGRSFNLSITTSSGYQDYKSGVSLPSPKLTKYQKFSDEPDETKEKSLEVSYRNSGGVSENDQESAIIPLQTLARSHSHSRTHSRSSRPDMSNDMWDRNSTQFLAEQTSAPSTSALQPRRREKHPSLIPYL